VVQVAAAMVVFALFLTQQMELPIQVVVVVAAETLATLLAMVAQAL
jgi:hypothetical protein